MSVKQAMIWTVCPVGQTKVTIGPNPGVYFDFSVIVSPRLESSSSSQLVLSDFPDWSPHVSTGVNPGRTWPDTIAALEPTFALHLPQLPGSPTYHAELVQTTTGALFGSQSPDSARWEAMFPENTLVTPYVFQGMETRQIRSAPVGQLSDTIGSLYGRFGMTSPIAFPLYDNLAPADAFGAIGFQQLYTLDRELGDEHPDPGIHGIGVDRKTLLTTLLDNSIKQSRAIPYDLGPLAKTLGSKEPPGAVTSLAFIQQQQFLQRGLKPHLKGPETPVTPPVWDFHQIVAGAASLPSLLRILGLVLDLRAGPVGPDVLHAWKTAAANKHFVPTEAIFVFNQNLLRMPPGETAGHTDNVRPPTATDTDLGIFRAQPLDASDTDLLDGRMLKLGDRKLYRIIRVDHDNAVMKAMQFADNLTRSRQQGRKLTLTTPDRFAMPALRTGGFAIARSGRAVQMAATLERQTTALQDAYFGSAPQKPLYAEDITRGYRFDVFSKPDPIWRSLMWREGTITVGTTDPVAILEEDAVVPAPTTATRSGKGDLYLQETLTRWDGWSLGVPRIGTAFYDPSTESPPSSNQGSTGFNVMTNWQVPGSNSNPAVAETNTDNSFRLPRLRFGWPYRLRGRAVDLAGNSIAPRNAPKSGVSISAYETHLRLEPVAAPRMLLLNPPDAGASEEVLVVRSENALDDGTLPIDTGVATRIILPAPTSVFMAEQHGAWDLPATGMPMDDSTTRYNDIATRDATTIESLGMLVDPSLPHSQTNPYLFPGYLPVSYLPDFIGRVALVRGLPLNSSKERVAKLPFDTAGAGWPSLQACRIVLSRGAVNWATRTVTDPNADIETTELDLTLDKGDMITCLLNCEIGAAALDVMGVWEWIQAEAAAAKLSSAKLKEIKASILAGEHWMFTPWREVRFVHAVRTPLLAPQLFLSPSKSSIGQTYAAFDGLTNAAWGTVVMSRKSTARIDVDATWSMPIDTGTNTDPVTPVPFAGHAFSLEIARVGSGKRPDVAHPPNEPPTDFENFDEAHQFNDTKFRAVTYQATATSYYIEYFRQEVTLASGGDPIATLRGEGAVKPGVAFEGATVKVFLVGTDSTDPDNPKIQTRPLVQAPIGTNPDVGAPTPGDYVVVQDPTLATDPSGAVNGTIQILADSKITSTDVAGTPSVVFSYVGPTIHTYSDPTTDHTTSASMHVPNSARPAAPDVLYVIPVYQRSATNSSITRTGGALRVYLNRPWWSSGDKERLGVVCWHQGSKNKSVTPPTSLAPYVTVWGFDPIHKSRTTLTSKTKQPTPVCFPLATASSSDATLTLDEVTSKVDVAGHDVGFDSDRGLWYCDIKVTSPEGKELESYTPFIRFAFARYQPTSIPNTHLSKVVTVDYAQLAPNRHVSVVGEANGNNGGQFAVTVAGYAPITPHSGKPSSGASRMRVTVEAQDVRILDDSLAWKPMTVNGKPLSQRLVSSVADTDRVTWTGSIVVPNGASPTRLTIEEFELIDGSERLAFCDSIPLSGLIT